MMNRTAVKVRWTALGLALALAVAGAGCGGSGSGGGQGAASDTSSKTLRVGIMTQNDFDASARAAGIRGISTGNREAQVRAVVADINAHGGVLGRKVVPVFHDVKSADVQANPATVAQAACSDWTQDHKVDVALNTIGTLNVESFFGCMSQAGVPLLISDANPHPDSTFAKFGNLFGIGVMSSSRIATTLVDRLGKDGYFSGWDTRAGGPGSAPVKVGVVYRAQDPGFNTAVVGKLAALGYRNVESFPYTGDPSTLSSQMSSAQLRFAAGNVTHVILESVDAALYFLPAAEKQQYRPRYGVHSLDGLALLAQTLPNRQFVGAMGIGWSQYGDVAGAADPGDSPAATSCRRLMTSAGQDTSSRVAFLNMAAICDTFDVIVAAAKASGKADAAGLRAGIESLDKQMPSAYTIGLRFGPRQHDGVAAVRDLMYAGGTFKYGKAIYPASGGSGR